MLTARFGLESEVFLEAGLNWCPTELPSLHVAYVLGWESTKAYLNTIFIHEWTLQITVAPLNSVMRGQEPPWAGSLSRWRRAHRNPKS